MELGGTNELHAAFLKESRTRDSTWSILQEIRISRSFSRDVEFRKSRPLNFQGTREFEVRRLWNPTSREKRARYGDPRSVSERDSQRGSIL